MKDEAKDEGGFHYEVLERSDWCHLCGSWEDGGPLIQWWGPTAAYTRCCVACLTSLNDALGRVALIESVPGERSYT